MKAGVTAENYRKGKKLDIRKSRRGREERKERKERKKKVRQEERKRRRSDGFDFFAPVSIL